MSLFYKFTNSEQIKAAAENGVFDSIKETAENLGQIDFCSLNDKPALMCNQLGDKVAGLLLPDGSVEYKYPSNAIFPYSNQYCENDTSNVNFSDTSEIQESVNSDPQPLKIEEQSDISSVDNTTNNNETASIAENVYEYVSENPGKTAALAIGVAAGLYGIYHLGKSMFSYFSSKPKTAPQHETSGSDQDVATTEKKIADLKGNFNKISTKAKDVSANVNNFNHQVQALHFDFSIPEKKQSAKRKLDQDERPEDPSARKVVKHD